MTYCCNFYVLGLNDAGVSAFCVGVRISRIKHFTEREFSVIFSLTGGGVAFLKIIPGGPCGYIHFRFPVSTQELQFSKRTSAASEASEGYVELE